MNDETSSMIIFPKANGLPYGVELSDTKYTNSVSNHIPNRWFFPLSENAGHTEAEYPVVAGQINDAAAYILFEGPTLEASFYEDVYFSGKHQLTISNNPSEWGNATKRPDSFGACLPAVGGARYASVSQIYRGAFVDG